MKKRLLSIFASIGCLACIAGFTTATLSVKADATSTPLFELHEGVQLKTTAEGMRWRLQMDEEYYNKATAEGATVGVLHFPSVLVKDVSDFSDYDFVAELTGANAPLNNVIDKTKIYRDEDANCYVANACVVNFKEENRTLKYMSVGYIRTGDAYEYSTVAGNDVSLYSRDIYSVLNSALMTQKYNDGIKTNYTWFGTEDYPVTISTAEEYTTIVNAVKNDSGLSEMNYRIAKKIALPEGSEKLPSDVKLSADSYGVFIEKPVTVNPIGSAKLNVPVKIEATATDVNEFVYTVTDPKGEAVAVSDAVFTPDLRGTYTVKVEINDGVHYGVSEQEVEVKKAGELVDFTSSACVNNFTTGVPTTVTDKYSEISYAENFKGKNAVKFVRSATSDMTDGTSTRINLRSDWTAYILNGAKNEFDGISISMYIDDSVSQDYIIYMWQTIAKNAGTIKAGSWQEVFIPNEMILASCQDDWNRVAASYNNENGGGNFIVVGKGNDYGTPASCPIYVSHVDFVKANPTVTVPDSALQGTEITVNYALSNEELQNVSLSCTVTDPDGLIVSLSEDGKFTASKAGTYSVFAEMSGEYTGYTQKNVIVTATTLLDCSNDSRKDSAFKRTSGMTSIEYVSDVNGTGRGGYKFVRDATSTNRTSINFNFDLDYDDLKALMNNELITGIEVDVFFESDSLYDVRTWTNQAVMIEKGVQGGSWHTVYFTKEKLLASLNGGAIDGWCALYHKSATKAFEGMSGLIDLAYAGDSENVAKDTFYIGEVRAVSR